MAKIKFEGTPQQFSQIKEKLIAFKKQSIEINPESKEIMLSWNQMSESEIDELETIVKDEEVD